MNKVLHSSKCHDYETPKDLFDKLSHLYGPFDLDAAATHKNTLCKYYLDEKLNALELDWARAGNFVFCNPPYGRGIKDWAMKAALQSRASKIHICMLLPARTGAKWFRKYIASHSAVWFLEGRLKFELNGRAGDAAPFDSCVALFNYGYLSGTTFWTAPKRFLF